MIENGMLTKRSFNFIHKAHFEQQSIFTNVLKYVRHRPKIQKPKFYTINPIYAFTKIFLSAVFFKFYIKWHSPNFF